MQITPEQLRKAIDHTLLKPEATPDGILRLCREAREYGFKAVCVQPCYVETCVQALQGSEVAVATVIGFPHGANCTAAKAFEARLALSQGAKELDMVINIGALKSRDREKVYEDIKAVVDEAAQFPGSLVKVIIEACLLNREEKILACQLAVEAGADYVKTSTGFAGGGATIEDVKLMAQTVGERAKVKASGGIRTREQALAFLAAGASRLGTSSGVAIMQENWTE